MHPCAPLVRTLDPIGLRHVLLATKCAGRITVYRTACRDGKLSMVSQGDIDGAGFDLIGRIAAPDPTLELRWPETLTFYGRWFDELAGVDRRGELRSKIAQAPLKTLLTQIQRDDRYAVVGTYYAVFRTILDCKRRLPLVLLNTSLLATASLPVILAPAQDEALEHTLRAQLYDLIRPALDADTTANGMDVAIEELEAVA